MSLNLQSVAELPVIEGIADGDYIVTVSGGKGQLLPAANFSGSKMTVFELAEEAVPVAAAEDGIDAQGAAPSYIMKDTNGSQITDPAVFREAFNTGIVRLALDLRASDGFIAFALIGDVWDFDTYIDVYFMINGYSCTITIGTPPEG